MNSEALKSSAIPYGGYRYQSLYGTSVLAKWLESPSTYDRMKFEADDAEDAPRGLDDIVAVRANGKYDYWQVKYTPPLSEESTALGWQWLLARNKSKPRSKSLLRKWFDAVAKIEPSKLGEVSLITNREPEAEFAKSLRGHEVIYDLIPPAVQAQLVSELGSEAEARSLFKVLNVRHSEHSFLNLEDVVSAQLQKVGADEDGIARLRHKTEDWSVFKDQPSSNGWITLDAVRAVLSPARPSPIPEDFVVPEGYAVPDTAFHAQMLADVAAPGNSVITVTGPPGRGKSTYLSHLCEALAKASIPFIRHHYFLSLQDRTFNRVSPFAVAKALLDQIERFHPNVATVGQRPEDLGRAVERCGNFYHQQGKPFVVVMDGLDHVWREHRDDIAPLEEILGQLIPAAPNVKVILGTQPVSDDRLPALLLSQSPRQTWRELPTMSVTSVFNYVMQQVEAKRWVLPEYEATKQAETLARALHARTAGHPLHVIYAVEEILAKTQHPQVWDVEKIALCPGGDIREYYRSLWHRLTSPQRDALHLICEFPFRWPSRALREMRPSDSSNTLSLEGVEHLLHETSAGFSPFHDSLVVFVREQPSHGASIATWLESVAAWLQTVADPHLRNCWLWRVQARQGHDLPLREGLTRDWCLDRLVDGYRIPALQAMLAEAERLAFEHKSYGEAYRLRTLKHRLYNGPLFQVEEPGDLYRCCWFLSEEQGAIDEIWHSRHELELEDLARLALALQARGEKERARQAVGDMHRRHREESRLRILPKTKERFAQFKLMTEAGIAVGAFDADKAAAQLNLDDYPREWLKAIGRSLELTSDVEGLLAMWRALTSPDKQEIFEEAAARLCCHTKAGLASWPESREFAGSSYAALYLRLSGAPARIPFARVWLLSDSDEFYERQHHLRVTTREWFLKSAVTALCADGAFSWVPAPTYSEFPQFADCLDRATQAAGDVAYQWKAGNVAPVTSVFKPFALASKLPYVSGYYQAQQDLEATLVQIALDVHTLNRLRGGPQSLDEGAIEQLVPLPWFDYRSLPRALLAVPHRVLSPAACKRVLADLEARVLAEPQETCEIASALVELTELATTHGDRDDARRVSRVAWDVILGYGHRKDPELDDVVTAIGYLAETAPAEALNQLRAIAPQIANVEKFTDGKGTRHVPDVAAQLLSVLDRARLAAKYEEDVSSGRWSHAEVSLGHYLSGVDGGDAIAGAATRLGLLSDELSSTNEPLSTILRKGASSFVGRAFPFAAGNEGPDDEAADDASSGFVFDDYPPARIAELLATLKGSGEFGYRVLPQWYRHWESRREGPKLLQHARPLALAPDARATDAVHLLDCLLETSLHLLGPVDRSFELAIEAHIQMNGWATWERSDRTEKRLSLVATHFSTRGDEFIQRSAQSWLTSSESNLVIPSEKLVYFLLKLGRMNEALQLTQAMVQCLHESTRNLRLSPPAWAA